MYMIIDKHVQMLLIVLQSETRMKINTQKHYLIFGSLCYEVQPAWMLYNKYMTASKWERFYADELEVLMWQVLGGWELLYQFWDTEVSGL